MKKLMKDCNISRINLISLTVLLVGVTGQREAFETPQKYLAMKARSQSPLPCHMTYAEP